MFGEFVTFLAHSSDCDSHNITRKIILGALNLVTILIRILNSSNRSDEGLTLETSALYGG